PAGSVVSQNPAGGAQVPPGSAVDLVISTGPCPVTVPNVVGMSQSNAESAITEAGLTVGTVSQQCSNTIPEGVVISHSPLSGVQLPPGSSVDLTVSTGLCPIQIDSIEELQKIGNDPDYPLNRDYELTQDIDASNTISWNSGAGFSPIGTIGNPFTGTFDGKGYKITGLYINRSGTDYVGLFGYISGKINNLGIENCQITGKDYVGGLAGHNLATISNCYSTGSVIGDNDVGGLVGNNSSIASVSKCYTNCTVSGSGYLVGGLVGDNYGSVSNCYSTGSVSGNSDFVGGLVGYNYYGTTSYCYSTGVVSGSGVNVGGLIGIKEGGSVSNCYWDIETSGRSSSAGGTGKTTAEMKQQATYVGWDFVNIWGIVENTIYPRFLWQFVVPEITGMTQSAAESALTEAGFTVGTVSQQCSNTIPEGVVISHSPLSGVQLPPGSSVDLTVSTGLCPIQIDSIEELQKIGNDPDYPLNRDYELTQDIDASNTISWNSGAGFSPIGTIGNPFTGTFDGKGYKITGLYINRSGTDYVGLFGYISGKINNLGIENCQITGKDYVGGLAGHNLATISNCYSTGSVIGDNDVGGLVGNNSSIASVSKCYTNCTVSGSGYLVGGLVGDNYGSVSNCYSTGSVSGNSDFVGGLVGYNYYGTTSYCYSTGVVSGSGVNVGGLIGIKEGGSVSNCYWDIETSGRSSSAGGTGKTTAEMKQQATYVGWDFTDRWDIIETCSYPWLKEITNPYLVQVPSVVDLTPASAEALLTGMGLRLGTVTQQCSNIIVEGRIVSQSPGSGLQIVPCGMVDIVVSTGPCIEGEGSVEGTPEGTPEGTAEGEGITEGEGVVEGIPEGTLEGEGITEGTTEGEGIVEGEGMIEGIPEGTPEGEGIPEGIAEGEGVPEGIVEGATEGEGTAEGSVEGTSEGTLEGEGIVEGTPEGTTEGTPEGAVEGTPEGTLEGEGVTEGEGEGGVPPHHSADQDGDGQISLSELLRIIQFFNYGAYHCDSFGEDGYAPGPGDQSCHPHASDYNPSDWNISLSELLRLIQFFNSGGYHPCPEDPESEDGYCPGSGL
ncbi:MAG TPA: PASTA domain-containing protein, partial [Candidatus Hydrogenedens sp.]|nr:PASTA domain-containing protein [Candidatus Hydrogenedens sp.]